MSELTFGTPASGELGKMLIADDIQPGDAAGYETCKRVFEYHPLGGKLAEKPIAMAMSQERNITIDGAPGDDVIEEFKRARAELNLDEQSYRLAVIAKIYGIGAMFIGIKDVDSGEPLTPDQLRNPTLYVNAVDPLNASGSLVLNQNPLDPDYLKPRELAVTGVRFHRSRSVVLMNEMPIYLGWTDSAFGFSGRSVYQRILFSLKSYIETMLASDMLARKVGVIVAKMEQQSSGANQIASFFMGEKRQQVKLARTGNVLSIGVKEDIVSLDLTNLGPGLDTALQHIREVIAAGSGTPAILINEETFASGLSEGSEDAKYVAEFVDGVRKWMMPVMAFTDRIAQARAWTEEFFAVIQERYPEYRDRDYATTVSGWRAQFKAEWPPYIKESETDKQRRVKEQLDALVSVFAVLYQCLDPNNKVVLVEWLADCVNSLPDMVPSQLMFDAGALQEFLAEQLEQQNALPEESNDAASKFGGGAAQAAQDALNRLRRIK